MGLITVIGENGFMGVFDSEQPNKPISIDKYHRGGSPSSAAPPKTGKNEAARALTPGALAEQLIDVANDFLAVGFPKGQMVITYALAQTMLESDWMTSRVANVDKNYSGIQWINKPYQNATKGLPIPASEGKAYYAHYPIFRDWAKDYLRVLSLNTGGQGRPIDATTAQQFVDRLKANHYFTSDNYYNAFNAALRKVGDGLRYRQEQDQQFRQQYNSGQRTFTETAGKGLTSNAEFDFGKETNKIEQYIKDHPLKSIGIAAAVLIGLKVILK